MRKRGEANCFEGFVAYKRLVPEAAVVKNRRFG